MEKLGNVSVVMHLLCLLFQTCQCAQRSSLVVMVPPVWWKTMVNIPACVLKVSMAGTVSWGRDLVTRGGVSSLSFHQCQTFYFGVVNAPLGLSPGLRVKTVGYARMLMGLLRSWRVTAWLVLQDAAVRTMWTIAWWGLVLMEPPAWMV